MAIPFETWGAHPHEIDAAMPGDDLIDDPAMSATRSIDLDCAPDEAFGWLTQMGFGRAGWYSYDLVDNLGRRSARRIHPEWQVTRPGDAVPGGPVDFAAAVVDPPVALVLSLLGQRLAGHRLDFTLAYVLSPPPHTTGHPPTANPTARPTANPPDQATAKLRTQPAAAPQPDVEPDAQPSAEPAAGAPAATTLSRAGPDHDNSTGGDKPSGSRLVCRARATIDGPAGRLVVPLLCLGDGIMVRRQLLGIRERCAR